MKIVICVEGDSDIKFIKDFVDYNKFEISSNDISYIKSGGKDKLSLSKQNLIQPDQDGINIIIQDLDSDSETERNEKVSKILEGFRFKLFFIKGGSLNCLEELLELSSVNDLSVFNDCWNSFNDCLSPIEFVKNKLRLKDKLHLYKLMCLNSNEDKERMKCIGDKEIDYINKRFFNLGHVCFVDLKIFFESILN